MIIQNSVAPLGSGATVVFDVVATDGGGTETRVTPIVVTVATTTVTTTTTTDRLVTNFRNILINSMMNVLPEPFAQTQACNMRR